MENSQNMGSYKRYLVYLMCGTIRSATYVNAFFPDMAIQVARGALQYGGKWWMEERPLEQDAGEYFIYLLHENVRACLFLPVSSSQEAVAEAERVLQPGHCWVADGEPSEQGLARNLDDDRGYVRGFKRTPHDWSPYSRLLVNAQNG